MTELQDPRKRIQLWCPALFAVGGIQAYSCHFLEALLKSPQIDLIDVLSRNDERLPAEFAAPASTRFSLCARNGESAGRLRFAAALLRAGLAQRPDLIITTHLFFAPVARWLRRLAGIPYWIVVHGIETWGTLRSEHAAALRHADRVLAVSRFSRDRLIAARHVESSRVAVLPNTFDETRFQSAPRPPELLKRYGLRPEQPVVLTVARLEASERYKGIDEMLAVFPDVLRAIPEARYLILGEGTDRMRLEKLVRDHHLEAAVTFCGGVSQDELCGHYNLCDLFAMPSRGEGFGIVFLEALACGKPVLAGNQDGSVDPLRDGELGVLVDPRNPSQLRDAVIAVLQKRHPHPHIFHPDFLHEQVTAHFGLEKFRASLDAQLREFFAARDSVK